MSKHVQPGWTVRKLDQSEIDALGLPVEGEGQWAAWEGMEPRKLLLFGSQLEAVTHASDQVIQRERWQALEQFLAEREITHPLAEIA